MHTDQMFICHPQLGLGFFSSIGFETHRSQTVVLDGEEDMVQSNKEVVHFRATVKKGKGIQAIIFNQQFTL